MAVSATLSSTPSTGPSLPSTALTKRALVVTGAEATKIRRLPLSTELRDGTDSGPMVDPAIIERAKTEGFQIGYTDGHAAGLETAERAAAAGEAERFRRIATAVDALKAATEDLREREALDLTGVEDLVLDMALALAEEVLGAELQLRSDAGLLAVRRALALAPVLGEIALHLNPEDAAALEDTAPELIAGTREHRIVADPSIAKGDCIGVVGSCRIDAQLAPALDRARQALFGGDER